MLAKRRKARTGFKGRKKKIDEQLTIRHERLRRRYPEVHGKTVDYIDHGVTDGVLVFTVRFNDKTNFSIRYRCDMFAAGADLCDVRTGNFKLIREYALSKSQTRLWL